MHGRPYNPGHRAGLRLITLIGAFVCLLPLTSSAQPATGPQTLPLDNTELRVGLKQAPPFVIKGDDGQWSGLAVELWRRTAARTQTAYVLVEQPSPGAVIDAVSAGRIDVGIGALSVTPGRERSIDFTLPYFNAGLGIATARADRGVLTTLKRLVSWQFLSAVAVLVLVLLAVGVLVWALERRRNAEQFGGRASQGIGNGFWWSAVTMTTVGYGDKAPVTPAGRVVALVWMFVSVITVSGFTAAIASSFTVDQLSSRIQGPSDLPKARVGALADAAAMDYLPELGVRPRSFATLTAAVQALSAGEIDAVVHDAPILRATLNAGDSHALVVLDALLRPEDYAFVVAQGSPLREQLNPALLEVIQSEDWAGLQARYIGP